MSDSGASLYDEVFEGLKCNRELEIYYNDSTYGVVTYRTLWQLWKDEDLLVECNDFWSICNYGLDPVIYAKMLRDRWFQLTKYRNF